METKKQFATPPAPQNALRRFQFFTGPEGKRFGNVKIHTEMQRFAWTHEGRKLFKKIQEDQKKAHLANANKPEFQPMTESSKIKTGLFETIKGMSRKITLRSQRGN